jgi:hypothetical protein
MPGRPWYDFAEVGSSRSFVVVVAMGALAPGHILIISRRHVERMGDLEIDELMDLEIVLVCWNSILARRWDEPRFVFEHGGRSSTSSAGCIAHAHLQMLPLAFDPIATYDSFTRIDSLNDLRSYRRLDYVMVWRQDRILLQQLRSAQIGQFFRRRICEAQGRPDAWDYLAFPNLETMLYTLTEVAIEDDK